MDRMKYLLTIIMIYLMLSITGCIHIHPAAPSEVSSADSSGEAASQPDTENPAADSSGEAASQPDTESPAADSSGEAASQPDTESPAADNSGEAASQPDAESSAAESAAFTDSESETSKKTTESSSEKRGKKEDKTSASKESSKARETGKDGLLTKDEAIAIVIKRVKGAKPSHIRSIELDHEDGRWQYEGELVYKGIEYEFEIDAQNGNILDWEIDD